MNKYCHVSIFAKGFPHFFIFYFLCFGEPRLSCSSVRFKTVILQLLRCEIFGLCWPNNRWLNKRDTMYFCRLTAVSLIVCHPPWQQQQTKQRAAGTVYFWRLTRKLGSPRFPLTKTACGGIFELDLGLLKKSSSVAKRVYDTDTFCSAR